MALVAANLQPEAKVQWKSVRFLFWTNSIEVFYSCLTCVPGVAFGRCKKRCVEKTTSFCLPSLLVFLQIKVMEKSFGMASKWTLDSAWDCTLSFSLPGCVSYKGAFSDHIT